VLVASKLADVVTTFVGLRLASGVREANPVVADAIAAVGAPAALLGIGVLAVAAVVVVTEAAAWLVATYVDPPPGALRQVRLVGYGLPSAVHVFVAAQNAVVLAST
jgi:hypothetical protein